MNVPKINGHLDNAVLAGYVEGRLPRRERAIVEGHLGRCSVCVNQVRELAEWLEWLKEHPQKAPEELLVRAADLARGPEVKPIGGIWPRILGPVALAAAALSAVVVLGGLLGGRPLFDQWVLRRHSVPQAADLPEFVKERASADIPLGPSHPSEPGASPQGTPQTPASVGEEKIDEPLRLLMHAKQAQGPRAAVDRVRVTIVLRRRLVFTDIQRDSLIRAGAVIETVSPETVVAVVPYGRLPEVASLPIVERILLSPDRQGR